MSDSMWKKEISFSKKRKDEDEPFEYDAAPKQSIWKKEINFGRKHKDDEPAETPEALRAKELAFRQRLEAAAQAAPVPAPEAQPEPEPVVDASFLPVPVPAPAAASEPESIWKKEITFRRKPAEHFVERVGAAPPVEQQPAAAEAPVSIWKKEIHLFKKPGDHAEKSDSIWTKEISFRRRQQWNKEIEEITQEALREVDEAEAVPSSDQWLAKPQLPPEPLADEPAPARKPAAPARKPAAAKVAPTAPAAPKQSVWKREIGGKKKPKAAAAVDKTAKPDEQPKPKRRLRDVQIGMPKRAPKQSHGGGSHQVKRLVGLKIGASQLAAARIANNGAAELVQVARQSLESGVVVGGEVRDPEALSLALKQFFAKNKLPKKNVRLGIASNRIGVRIFDLVGIDDERQLENAIRFRAQETLPIPLDEAVLDYHVLGETTDEDGATMQRVLLVVAYRELVERYVGACKKAGITLAGVDLEAFALLRSLAAPRPEDTEVDSALVAVAIGHDRSTFAVSDGRICEFTRVIEWGGSTLSVAIARALDLAPSEVEQLKRLVSLESPAVPDGIAPEQYAAAVDAVRRQVQAFARELVSSLQFYQHQPGSLGIGEIVITGGTAGLAGIAAELQGLIGVRVRVGDPLARLKVAKKLAVEEDLGSYAIAIGLGIED